jgi:galactitol-specific phosphotransferase system IIC component
MAVVKSCGVLLGSVAGQDINGWLNLLLVYDAVVTMLSIMVFEYVIQE